MQRWAYASISMLLISSSKVPRRGVASTRLRGSAPASDFEGRTDGTSGPKGGGGRSDCTCRRSRTRRAVCFRRIGAAFPRRGRRAGTDLDVGKAGSGNVRVAVSTRSVRRAACGERAVGRRLERQLDARAACALRRIKCKDKRARLASRYAPLSEMLHFNAWLENARR